MVTVGLLLSGLPLSLVTACSSDSTPGGGSGGAGGASSGAGGKSGGHAGATSDASVDGGGAAGNAGGADGGPTDCFTNPKTHFEIINACTSAEKVDKESNLPLLLADGGLPPLP